MARSWQYPRWRRIVVQVVLWVVFAATIGVAQLVVRHRQLVGSVDLAPLRMVDLPGGVEIGVRLPKGWPVDHDAAEHGGDDERPSDLGDSIRAFEAHEPAGGVDGNGDPDAEAADAGHGLVILCEPLTSSTGAKEYLESRAGLKVPQADPSDPPDPAGSGDMAVAGVTGYWAAVLRSVPVVPGHRLAYRPAYVAVGVVPAGPATPVPVAVTVLLDCPPGDADVAGDRDLLRRVAAAVTVSRSRVLSLPTARRLPGSLRVDR